MGVIMKTNIYLKVLLPFSLIILSLIFTGGKMEKKKSIQLYRNQKLSINDGVNDLIKRMTLEEKLNLLGGTGFATKPIERLGIPELKMSDGPLGVRWDKSTAFPAGIAMAATWDTSLIHQVGAALGRELKEHGRDVLLGPCVNIARIPQGGRVFESFGEDPYLASRMAVSYIEGVQSEGVGATVKHFASYNQEYQRMFVNVEISKRALNEIYLPAFKAAVEEAGVLCVMSAYNKVNGKYCSENDYLLKPKLKDKWGFKGLVMSDWGAVHSSIPTAQGGLDLEMPTGIYLNPGSLMTSVKNGTVKEETINDKVKRILTVMFKLGLFDNSKEKKSSGFGDSSLISSEQNKKIAYKASLESITLLKNENNILPIKKDKIKSVAVIGPDANVAITGGGGSAHVEPIFSINPMQALRKKLENNIKINYAQGSALVGNEKAVSEKYLMTPDKKENGLYAEFFDNTELKGKPSFTRIDSTVDFNWGDGSPKEGFASDNFSSRWTGYIKPNKSGEYTFYLTSDDGVRFYFENKLVINDWTDHAALTHSYQAKLEAGKEYKIKIEYYEHTGGAEVKFSWRLNGSLIKDAVEAASKSDIAIIFAGTSQYYESEGSDRDSLSLPGDQDKLISEVAKHNKHVVVVIVSGSPVLMNKWINKVDGVIEDWFGGSEEGNAIADILLGNYNPSGKLPITFPKSWKDCSAYGTYKAQDSVSKYSDEIYVGYRHFDHYKINPLFPFGYGLSYTQFSYSNLKISRTANDNVEHVSFTLKNTGKTKGAEVVQLYINEDSPRIDRPEKELKNFARVILNPGESQDVNFTITKKALEYYDPESDGWKVDPGKYNVLIGSSSRDIKLRDSFTWE
jgi:beta-glucosidase